MSLRDAVRSMALKARQASLLLAKLPQQERRNILLEMANGLLASEKEILQANVIDCEEAVEQKLSEPILDRLRLDETRLQGMVHAVRNVAQLPDPLGEVLRREERPNGLHMKKVRVPIGVIGIIYESRPNVTADSGALCIKTGNSVILRPGTEALRTSLAIADGMREAGVRAGLPPAALQVLDNPDREAIRHLVQLVGDVDLVIPRGGEGLIQAITEWARVPVIKHYKGVCHTYVDQSANIKMAVEVAVNAKCQRPGVCNAMETLLVHQEIAAEVLPKMAEALRAKGVEIRGDIITRSFIPWAVPASEEDWSTEYLALILAVKVVPSLDAAIEHINHFGSHHSDAIITQSENSAEQFLQEVDSAAVYVNASTRFTDGGEFGMGAEIGISTDKLHARGPMGLEELTTYKYVIRGEGQVRAG